MHSFHFQVTMLYPPFLFKFYIHLLYGENHYFPAYRQALGGQKDIVCHIAGIIFEGLYRILGIVHGRKLSRITFTDVVCENTFVRSPILCSPDN